MQKVPQLLQTFIPDSYSLHLTVEQKKRVFSGAVTIKGTRVHDTSTSISFHTKALTISKIAVNGIDTSWKMKELDELQVTLPADINSPQLEIYIEYTGTIKDNLHGLYLSQYEHEGKTHDIFVTQLESHHAREVLPCIDEPAAKATFDLTVTTESGMQVLGNMPAIENSEKNGLQTITFDTTPHMSTYLLALVIGDLQHKHAQTKSGVDVRVWATPVQNPEALDFSLDHAVRSIEFFEEYFDVPYPLPKSDQVALPDFGSGAMENWGLITYREMALLVDPNTTTIASKQYVATVVSHELSHQWFGNLVTMKWWNNLWLNESFATIMEYIAVDAIHPEWNAWLDFTAHETIMAMRRDAIAGVQPVQVEVNHPDEIATIFDGAIVYAKGARLMAMLRSFVGEAAFRKGLKQYFDTHAYNNTTEHDLWSALSDASGKDVEGFMTPWISQPGYPVVHITNDSISQQRFFTSVTEPSDTLWTIPLDSTDKNAPAVLDSNEISIQLPLETRFNTQCTTHAITHYDTERFTTISANIHALSDSERVQLINESILLARSGHTSSAQLIPLINAFQDEQNDQVWALVALAIAEIRQFVANNKEIEAILKENIRALCAPHYSRLGWSSQANEKENETKLRSTIIGLLAYADHPEVLRRIDETYKTAELSKIDSELRGVILSSVVKRAADTNTISDLLDIYTQTAATDIKDDICSGLTSVQQPEHITMLLTHLTNKAIIRPQDNARWFAYLIRNRHAREATWQWMKDNWQWIEDTFGGDKSYDYYPRYAAGGLRTLEELTDYSTFFSKMKQQPSLARTIAMGEHEIHARIDLLERDTQAVADALRTHTI